MTTSKITNYFLKHLRYEAPNPRRDWFVLIILSTITFAGIVVWNVWAFGVVANGGIIGSPEASTTPSFSRSSLDQINTIFSNRAAEEKKYETGTYRYADPSQ
jgi:hypothetical protein